MATVGRHFQQGENRGGKTKNQRAVGHEQDRSRMFDGFLRPHFSRGELADENTRFASQAFCRTHSFASSVSPLSDPWTRNSVGFSSEYGSMYL